MPNPTNFESNVRKFMPLASKIASPEGLDRDKRVDRALSGSGMIQGDAIEPLGFLVVAGIIDDVQKTTTSTVSWTDIGVLNVDLGEGTWTIFAEISVRGGNASGTNNRLRTVIDGVPNTDVIDRSAPTTSAAPFFDFATRSGVDGGRSVQVKGQVQSSSGGNAIFNDCRTKVTAIRTK